MLGAVAVLVEPLALLLRNKLIPLLPLALRALRIPSRVRRLLQPLEHRGRAFALAEERLEAALHLLYPILVGGDGRRRLLLRIIQLVHSKQVATNVLQRVGRVALACSL